VTSTPEESRARLLESLERGRQARASRLPGAWRDRRQRDERAEWWREVDRLIALRRRAEREEHEGSTTDRTGER
jgi:hypothetical protein